MARRRTKGSAAPTQSPPPPPVPAGVATGLGAIRLHGNRDEELYLSADGSFFEEPFMTERIITAEENTRFIKKIESLVRSSIEYKAYLSHLRNDLGMDHCSFLPNLDMTTDEIGLEMHHCPLTLYQLVDIVISHRLARRQPVTSLSIADEVMRMHFEESVGMVPLSVSVHKLVHAGSLIVHPAMVHGDYLKFMRAYCDGVTEEIVAGILAFISMSENDVAAAASKIDGANMRPRLRADARVPTHQDIDVLLLPPASDDARR